MTARKAPPERRAYRLKEAAESYGVSLDVLRKAVHTSDPNSFPPPLTAKWVGGRLGVHRDEMDRWYASLRDA